MMFREINIPTVLNPVTIDSLTKQLSDCETEHIRFIVLKGSESVFCNGLDLAWVSTTEEDNYLRDMALYAAFLKKLQAGKFISVALIKGAVSGGGMGIVCACDHVIAVEESTFSLPEGLLGLIPGMILPSLLNRLSPQRIKKMVLTGKKYSSTNALEYGVVDELSGDLPKALTEFIAATRSCKPGAVNDIKEMLYTATSDKDELAVKGMNILIERLKDSEIKQRLQDLSDFM